MADNEQLMSAVARLVLLPDAYGRSGVLLQLMGTATEVLGLSGAAVTLIEDGHCEVAGATPDGFREVEAAQRDCERGPGMEALRRGESVAVEDVREHRGRWPEYATAAARHGISAVAEIPMQLGDIQVGALGLFAPRPRHWTEGELSVGRLLAGMAAGHLLTADKLQRQQRLTDQLQHALTSRIVVEQAKGVIAGAQRITPEAAYELIRGHARRRRVGVHEVARAIVELGLRL
ncbi:GAF and ANTAR domain-containing protein [Nocardia sp. CDC159]|uniref:GAF and ANTAR domain-containing protein n=1 Tax=Nocardia pulmonis TaxID=2951408 RepID=A0A9X2E9H4_9NOCA|nr:MULTISPECIES: GAF and ANTAR domain-containing protein [Nocardia]MCM6775320.1 GAF and ANTAR domain-containing protein [Nocardia pulmonis]MCM6787946.1 GAF and ANTAR domain-containing protein [Nocardia sp. CDC159]